jgi:hypothetical protein
MKLGSRSVLNKARDVFGLEDDSQSRLERCLDFITGDVLLRGPWAQPAPLLHGGLRRTQQGGENLPEDWTIPPPETRRAMETA